MQFSTDLNELKEQNESLKVKIASEVKKHAKTAASLGNEKPVKNALQVEIKHQKELHDTTVKNLNERIEELISDKRQYMGLQALGCSSTIAKPPNSSK